jgi:uncharacterized membrane protein
VTEEATEQAASAAESDPDHKTTWGDRFRWVFWRHLCFGGLAGALVFFCLSLTPSLLPRVVFLQGAVTGITMVIGYGLGSAISSLVRKVIPKEPSADVKRIAWWLLIGATIVFVPSFLVLGRDWQEQVRDLMGMTSSEPWKWGAILVVSVIVAGLVLIISRLIRGLGRVIIRFIYRFVPRLVAQIVGVALTVVIVLGFIQGFVLDPLVSLLNSSFSVVNDGTSEGIVQPTNPERSGSPDSVVPWDSLGVKGRDFIGSGPSVAQIGDFTGRESEVPIRVYVGLKSADSVEERVDLAMQELDRTGAWERDVLTVFTTTGTGWVDARAADPLEYMHNGDTALVALQYSYLPSWISFIVDQEKAAEAGRGMIEAVQERWSQLPPDSRPQLLLFGESLGSFGTESAFDDIDDMIANTDGALLVGPVFSNDIHSRVTDDREQGSPFWRPIYDAGGNVRFAVSPPDLDQPETDWSPSRIVYLQNSSDPITYWAPELLWKPPDWLDDPRGPDVSGDMSWVPIITFWQTAADMAFSTGVPAGHGHVYGANPVDAWAAIYTPEGWTAEANDRLRDIIGHEK